MSRSDRDSMVGVWGADKRRTNSYKLYMSKKMEAWKSGQDDRVTWEKHQEAFNKRFTAEDATTRLRLEELVSWLPCGYSDAQNLMYAAGTSGLQSPRPHRAHTAFDISVG